MKLSKNFSSSEFVEDYENQPLVIKAQLPNLCQEVLQPWRNTLEKPVTVTSGVRTIEDLERLRKAGYNPSETSDHYCGVAVPLESPKKKKKYGDFYTFSVGAADCVPAGDVFEAFKLAVELTKEKIMRAGQVIYETNGAGTEWIHISNTRTSLFSSKVSVALPLKLQFLVSKNYGKSYQIYNG